jgi:hypothetical protein
VIFRRRLGLGKALSDPNLKGSTFVVAGHTDAVGSEIYNQDLSERRTDSIKRYLVDKFGIASNDLVYASGQCLAGGDHKSSRTAWRPDWTSRYLPVRRGFHAGDRAGW